MVAVICLMFFYNLLKSFWHASGLQVVGQDLGVSVPNMGNIFGVINICPIKRVSFHRVY